MFLAGAPAYRRRQCVRSLQRSAASLALVGCCIGALAFSISARTSRRVVLNAAGGGLSGSLWSMPTRAQTSTREGFTETSSGLQYKVVREGSGARPAKGVKIAADYT